MKISKETIIRTILLAVALLNQVLTIFGKNPLPFSENEMYFGLTNLATVFVAIWAWWKNNSFTKEAIKADQLMNKLKGKK